MCLIVAETLIVFSTLDLKSLQKIQKALQVHSSFQMLEKSILLSISHREGGKAVNYCYSTPEYKSVLATFNVTKKNQWKNSFKQCTPPRTFVFNMQFGFILFHPRVASNLLRFGWKQTEGYALGCNFKVLYNNAFLLNQYDYYEFWDIFTKWLTGLF